MNQRSWRWPLRLLKIAYVGLIAALPVYALADNYAATVGSGTTFGSHVVTAVNYAEMMLCDFTAPSTQCAAVSAGGAVSVAGPVTNAGTFATQLTGATNNINNIAGTVSLPTGAATSALQTTINTTLGSPFQAGGSIGNTTFAATQSGTWNVTNISGTVSLPTGASTATNQATEIASLATIATNTGAAVPSGTARIGYTSDDPCSQKIKTTAPFTTTSGGPVSIVALSGSTVVYVCSITAVADTAIKLSFIDGTGGSCAAAQHAIWGSITAASGMSLAANGGFSSGSGNGTVGQTTAASAFCLLQSGTSLVAGNISYVQQ